MSENSTNNLLRVYRLENDERILNMEEQVSVPVNSGGFVISLAQLAANSPVQVLNTPPAPADSSSIALQFFYGDAVQPEEVKITILAVDQLRLRQTKPAYTLGEVHDTMKAVVGEINLRRSELSEPIVLNFYRFKNPVGQQAARFFTKSATPTTIPCKITKRVRHWQTPPK